MTNLPSRTILAVLPFGNMGADKDVDFLRLALPDEIATTLSHVRSLSIRPFATTSKYLGPDTDLQKAGREMRVNNIVTGHFLKAGDQLQVTLEAIDVDANVEGVCGVFIGGGAGDQVAIGLDGARGEVNAIGIINVEDLGGELDQHFVGGIDGFGPQSPGQRAVSSWPSRTTNPD